MTQEEIDYCGEKLRGIQMKAPEFTETTMICGHLLQLAVETSRQADATVSCARALERIATSLEKLTGPPTTATGVRILEEKRL